MPTASSAETSVYVLLRPATPVPVDELVAAARRGRILDRGQFVRRYAPADEARARLAAFAEAHGLTVVDAPPAWSCVELVGRAAQLHEAFPNGPRDPVPEALAEIATWVFRLGFIDQPEPELPPTARGATPRPPAGEPDPRALQPQRYFPPRFVEWYGFDDRYRGAGQCLGLISLVGGYRHEDLDALFSAMDMPRPEIVDVGANVWATARGDLWINYEISMDLQIASSCAPEAKTVVYFAGGRTTAEVDLWHYYKAYSMAIFDEVHRPSVLTLSGGMIENLPGYWTKAEAEVLEGLFAAAACVGVSLVFPSGDSGSNHPTAAFMFDMPAVVVYPGSSPWALCVGGTTVEIDEAGALVGERVWNRLDLHMNLQYRSAEPPAVPSSLGASGGGVSRYFPRPAWQAGAGVPLYHVIDFTNWVFNNPEVFEGRGVPDVAACGDFLTGYKVHLDGRWCHGGGTSASTPLWAALIARINQALGRPVGFLTPVLYELAVQHGAELFNRPTGSNGAYEADPAKPWNPCTGLGTPRGEALIEALRSYYEAAAAETAD